MAKFVETRYVCDECEHDIEWPIPVTSTYYFADETPALTMHFCSRECRSAWAERHGYIGE